MYNMSFIVSFHTAPSHLECGALTASARVGACMQYTIQISLFPLRNKSLFRDILNFFLSFLLTINEAIQHIYWNNKYK